MIRSSDVGAILRQLRLQAGLTQSEAAAAVGHHKSWLSKLETGDRGADLTDVSEYAIAMGWSVDVVFSNAPGTTRARIGEIDHDALAVRARDLIARLNEHGRESFEIFLDVLERTQAKAPPHVEKKLA